MMEIDVKVRRMGLVDVDKVMKVELDAFTVPWTRKAFVNELLSNQFAYYFVAETNKEIIGYIGSWIVVDEAQVTKIAILSTYRGHGIGDLLLKAMLEYAKILGVKKFTLEVRVSNEVAINLYKKNGFQNGGIRKKYYTDNQEDARVMWVNLDE